jgi:hypothetical protein
MRRFTSAMAIAALAVTASCGDTAAPTAATPTTSSPSASLSRGGSYGGQQYSFDLSPQGGVYWLGQYMLVVPANAVCDPARSSYGAGTWNDPCPLARRSIHMTATVTTVDGRDYVDFSPDIRFAPSSSQSGWVTLHTFRLAAIGGRGDLRRFSILFAQEPGGPLVDESATDPTVATHVNTRTGAIWRRVKHFTGYNVYSGLVDDCTPVGTVIPDGAQ